MKILQEKLDFLLEKYSVEAKVTLKDEKTAVIGGEEYPLLAHRSERRFLELKNIVNGGTLVGVSVMRVARIVAKSADIYAELYRELDLCQYILQKKLVSITVMENGNVLNAIATAENGVVCTLEISATLREDEPAKDKHEIISQRGIACDVVVDAQLQQDSIYVFGQANKKFTDVDFELYGLTPQQIAVVRSAFALAQDAHREDRRNVHENLTRLVELAKNSARSGKREVL